MTVPAVSLTPRPDHGLGAGASAGAILELAARDDFHRWEAQLAATGHCANPIRLAGRLDAIDRATGQARVMYDTHNEPGGVLRIACGNRREHICPACSTVYKNDASASACRGSMASIRSGPGGHRSPALSRDHRRRRTWPR